MSTRDSRAAWLLVTVLMIPALAHAGVAAQVKPLPAFEKMKELVGTWQGTTADGHPVEISYRLVSGGTALLSEMKVPGMEGHDMVTMIHPDGGRLLLTHYCSGNNQPRMTSKGVANDGKTIDFDYLDATNLASADATRMSHVTYTFKDPDHYTEAWTSRVGGKDSEPWPFTMERKR